MDRNELQRSIDKMSQVALRKESVDRNPSMHIEPTKGSKSLSARRAWIEIQLFPPVLLPVSSRSPQVERG